MAEKITFKQVAITDDRWQKLKILQRWRGLSGDEATLLGLMHESLDAYFDKFVHVFETIDKLRKTCPNRGDK